MYCCCVFGVSIAWRREENINQMLYLSFSFTLSKPEQKIRYPLNSTCCRPECIKTGKERAPREAKKWIVLEKEPAEGIFLKKKAISTWRRQRQRQDRAWRTRKDPMMASLQGLLLFTLLHVTLFFEEVSTLNCACCFYLKIY